MNNTSDKTKSIMFFHLDGSILGLFNSNLLGIIKHLISNNITIYYCTKKYKGEINPSLPRENFNIIFLNNNNEIENNEIFKEKNISLIIGIDLGIVIAEEYANKYAIQYGLLSYELYFKDEFNESEKSKEVNACKNISFAISQDSVRATMLSIENNININKILSIPVADFYKENIKQNNLIRDILSIPNEKKILFYGGNIKNWSGIDFILDKIHTMPDEWVLVIHNIYGKEILQDKRKSYHNGKVFYTDKVFTCNEDYEDFISSADLGIAFYYNDYLCPETGKNIYYIGLSSGKISTYLKCGVPILINEIGEMAYHVRKKNIGYVIETLEELDFNFLNNLDINSLKTNTISFFKSTLALDNYINEFMDIVINDKNSQSNKESSILFGLGYQTNLLLKTKDLSSKSDKITAQYNEVLKQYEELSAKNEKIKKKLNNPLVKFFSR